MRLSDEQRLDWLRLIRSESVGPRTFRGLINRCGSAAAALDALPDLARRGGRRQLHVASRAEAEREIAAAAKSGARLVALGEPDYPLALQAIDTAPPLILVTGDAAVTARPCVAIVGSRNASASGRAFTDRLASGLGREGFVVVSGLARGVDTRAHVSALSTGTIAVLAGGLDRVYPTENAPLLERIVGEGGAVLSEMPMGWQPRGRDFPRRNRIVSGLCLGVVVVEAARRSGSLITARFALEQGREVFAVPGSPLDPRAEGTNDLLRGGATLCAGVDHVVEVLAPIVGGGRSAPAVCREDGDMPFDRTEALWDELDFVDAAPAAPAGTAVEAGGEYEDGTTAPSGENLVLSLLGPSPILVDELARQADLPVRTLHLLLTELELRGRLERHGASGVSLNPDPVRP